MLLIGSSGIDPNLQAIAVERAAKLIQEVAGGTLADEIIDIHPVKTEKRTLTLRKSYVNRLLGTDLTERQIVDILEGLELETIEISLIPSLMLFPPSDRI